MRCASAGVNRFDVDGSALRSYTAAGHVVWIDRFGAKMMWRLEAPGVDAERSGTPPNGCAMTGAEAFKDGFAYGDDIEGGEMTSVGDDGGAESDRLEDDDETTPSTCASLGI